MTYSADALNAPAPAAHANGGGYEEDSGTELMLRARDGDDSAFEELFRRHSGPLIGLAFRMVGDRDRAEELVQEAFLRIYRRRKKYRPEARFSTYAYRVVMNLCLNEFRRSRFLKRFVALDDRGFVSANGSGTVSPQIADDRIPTGEEEALGAELLGRFQEELSQLPEKQKSAILLSRVEGLPYQQIAEVLGMSLPAVKSTIFRGMRALREKLTDVIEGNEGEERS